MDIKDKQIEEMYKDVYEAINHNAVIDITHGGYIGVATDGLTRELYDDGYRKASDIIDEIVDFLFELEKIERLYAGEREALGIRYAIKKIKEKYTEGEG